MLHCAKLLLPERTIYLTPRAGVRQSAVQMKRPPEFGPLLSIGEVGRGRSIFSVLGRSAHPRAQSNLARPVSVTQTKIDAAADLAHPSKAIAAMSKKPKAAAAM
jgi:hypothetical protein